MDHNPEVMAGIELVRRSFLNKLAEHNVTLVPSAGQPFNPDLHDAVTTIEATKKSEIGTVMAVISEGYALGNEILRPARVAVGKKK
jgi:molecular chaperone GrpE